MNKINKILPIAIVIGANVLSCIILIRIVPEISQVNVIKREYISTECTTFGYYSIFNLSETLNVRLGDTLTNYIMYDDLRNKSNADVNEGINIVYISTISNRYLLSSIVRLTTEINALKLIDVSLILLLCEEKDEKLLYQISLYKKYLNIPILIAGDDIIKRTPPEPFYIVLLTNNQRTIQLISRQLPPCNLMPMIGIIDDAQRIK